MRQTSSLKPALLADQRATDVVEGAVGCGAETWTCLKCTRVFTRKNQRHACGTGNRSDVLRNRPDAVVALYTSLESFAMSLGPIELVARERYVLFRTVRIFADMVIMTDAVRVAVHLARKIDDAIFFKVVSNDKVVTHVAKLQTESNLRAIEPYLREAYEFSLAPKRRAE